MLFVAKRACQSGAVFDQAGLYWRWKCSMAAEQKLMQCGDAARVDVLS